MKVLLIGGSGLLGSHLKSLNHQIISPSHEEFDIEKDLSSAEKYFDGIDVVINSAAVKDNRKVENDPFDAVHCNIVGAAHIANWCHFKEIRYVYISTDYIYKGDRGNYKEDDEILPFNLYAWTKLGGECSARCVKNHLIIRTSFGDKFEYPVAFDDKWTSKDYVEEIAPLILEAAMSPLTGVLNIGTERKTIYQHAKEKSNVMPIKLSESHHSSPYDTSLNLQKWIDYKSSNAIAKPNPGCRVCGSDKLVKYLDLGLMPLANNLEFTSMRAKEKERFPLQVMLCPECGLSQLSVVIDPEKMFSYYTYRSSVNAGYVEHCKKMAEYLYSAKQFVFHIDIAGNDGALLNAFRKEVGIYMPLNIEPASNLAAISEAQDIATICDFWSSELAYKIIEKYGRKVDLITATNVFAHVDDITDFIRGCYIALDDNGILVIECPYLIDFIEKLEYDTIYFEHLSYISVLPVHKLCSRNGLKIIDVEKFPIHGGTIRLTIAKDSSDHYVSDSVIEFVDYEQQNGYGEIKIYHDWAKKVKESIRSFGENILSLKKKGNKIAAFAASAKGNTLLNACGLNTDIIEYIVDETSEKIGKFSPGTGIPIVHKKELENNPPDYLILLSWNFKEALIEKAKECGFTGKFIIPIPEFTIE